MTMEHITVLPDKTGFLKPFYGLDKDWCLPPRFWDRATMFEGYNVCHMPRHVAPHRRCHYTSLLAIKSGKNVKECNLGLATGFAFSAGCWFRHTWVVNPPDKTLLECTPSVFEVYYGAVLTKKEEREFEEMMEA